MLPSLSHPSPNFDGRKHGAKPSLVILHYTGMQNGALALSRLCDAKAKVSAHYLVEEDGRVFSLVGERHRAWHAGISYWRGERDINSHSIGVEIVNPGHEFGYRPFPPVQMEAVRALCVDIKQRHALPANAFWGHSDIAPMRKMDPGAYFDWPMLARSGIGVWPDRLGNDMPRLSLQEAQCMLARIGYDCPQSNAEDAPTRAVIMAFQRHFNPQSISGTMDAETQRRLIALQQFIL